MAGISPSIFQPQPYAGYNPSYAPSGYMPGAPPGFIMNPFVNVPPKSSVYETQPYIGTDLAGNYENRVGTGEGPYETPQQQQEREIDLAKIGRAHV